jgi:hypothetical protein
MKKYFLQYAGARPGARCTVYRVNRLLTKKNLRTSVEKARERQVQPHAPHTPRREVVNLRQCGLLHRRPGSQNFQGNTRKRELLHLVENPGCVVTLTSIAAHMPVNDWQLL